MSKKVIERLRSKVGESIAEVLVALLISAVGVAMLVGMIGVSTRIIDKSTQYMRDEYKKTDISGTEDATVTLTGGDESQGFDIVNQKHNGVTIYYTPK
jgi:Tfp pilus assembly protein PilV